MEILVGTTGWSNHLWNPNGLPWYVEHSGLNAIELNMSFYHLPTAAQVEEWAEHGPCLLWSIKVPRTVTHFFRFNHVAMERFLEFRELFAPLDPHVGYYLFQLPPNAHPTLRDEIEQFFVASKLGSRFALELKNSKWFTESTVAWAKRLGITLVSADAPMVPRDIFCVDKTVYLRLHGRSDWFEHHYSRKELSSIAEKIKNSGAERVVAFLNNQTAQLKNARALRDVLQGKPE